eukprot:6863036-Pyramimonas_sp.AAC.1
MPLLQNQVRSIYALEKILSNCNSNWARRENSLVLAQKRYWTGLSVCCVSIGLRSEFREQAKQVETGRKRK